MTPSCVPCAAVSVGEFMIVGERARSAAEAAPAAGSIALARPKSRTLTVPSAVSLTFCGLEVAVDDALLVRGLERLGDLPGDGQRLVERQRAARERADEILALDELHDQRAHAVRLFEAVDRGDVRMMQLGEQLRFALEAGEALRVGGEGDREDLDRHLAPELGVGGAIDLAHAAFAQLGADLVGTEAGAGGGAHGAPAASRCSTTT